MSPTKEAPVTGGLSQIVEYPQLWPGQCIDGNQKGPVWDTRTERAGERIYLSKQMVKQAARDFGFAPGKNLDVLENASNQLEAKEQDIKARDERIASLEETIRQERRAKESLMTLLEQARGKDKQYTLLVEHLQGPLSEIKELAAR